MMKFNNIEPRTREERAALKDKEKIEDYRLKQRIGGYHKYVDNAQVSQPDPISSHFMGEAERFDKDFATYDKKIREQQYQQKLEVIERKRVEKFERDLQRWKYMDQEEEREKHKIEYMNEHYQTGKKNKGGAAYNVISLDYDNSKEGSYLKKRDDDAKVRALVRSKNIDMRANCGYNLLTGDQRPGINVPQHEIYNPYEYNAAQNAGKDIVFGSAPVADRISNSRGGQEEAKLEQLQAYAQAAPSAYPAPSYQAPPQEQPYQAPPAQPSYQAPPQEQLYQASPAQPSYQAPPQEQPYQAPPAQSSNQAPQANAGGVQLPIGQKDYSAFGGNNPGEGAGIGGGYSQPMQQMEAQPADFQGGTGSKFY